MASVKKPEPRILFLTLVRKWFDAIAAGKKKEEYRDIKPYFAQRFLDENGKVRRYDEVHFRNGYASRAPFMRVKWEGLGYKTFDGERKFAVRLGKVLEIKNWSAPKFRNGSRIRD